MAGANVNRLYYGTDTRAAMLLIPGTAAADMIARGWIGSAPELVTLPLPVPVLLVDVMLLIGWTAAFGVLAASRWRWTPRG